MGKGNIARTKRRLLMEKTERQRKLETRRVGAVAWMADKRGTELKGWEDGGGSDRRMEGRQSRNEWRDVRLD